MITKRSFRSNTKLVCSADMNFKNQVAVITGGTGALGSAVAKAFVNSDANVVILYNREAGLKTVASFENKLTAIKTDVLSESSVQSMVEQVVKKLGRIDILVNAVGGFIGGVPIVETTEAQLNKMFDLNLRSAFLCSKHIFPIMIKQKFGRIINIGSKGGLNAASGMGVYSASKAAVINFSGALAEEGREHNITANVVIPSIIDTEANRSAMPDANFDDWVKTQSIADLILYLSSKEANDVSGGVIPIYDKS